MKDRKEVIEILWDGLKAAAHYGENYVNGINVAEQLYARIAPLREFPEEAVILCQKFDTSQRWLYDPIGDSPPKYSLTELITDLKRLWEGTEAIVIDGYRFPFTPIPFHPGPEGICPTCGGDRKLGTVPKEQKHWVACPACGGTGDRRVGERRVNDEKYWPPGFGRRIKGSDDDRRFYTTRKVDEIIKHEMGGFPYSACKYVPLGRRSNGKSRRKGVTTRRDGEERRKGEKS